MTDVFRIRSYGRTELAIKYFPNMTHNAAWKKLKGWIAGCKGLKDRLAELEYDSNRRSFTPAQVKAIVEYLDEP